MAVRWVAGKDGIAHAQGGRGDGRAACGRLGLPPRFAWPAKSRCPVCVERTEAAAAGAAS